MMGQHELDELINEFGTGHLPGQVTKARFGAFVSKKQHRRVLRDLAGRFDMLPDPAVQKRIARRWEKATKTTDPVSSFLAMTLRDARTSITRAKRDFTTWKEEFKVYLFKMGMLNWMTLLELPGFSRVPVTTRHVSYQCESCGANVELAGTDRPLERDGKRACIRCFG